MSYGSAKINATPSHIATTHSQEMGVELLATKSRDSKEFKYTNDFGVKGLIDPLIDYRHDFQSWSTPQDIECVIICHAENGQRISYVEIKFDQSSEQRDVHIVGGGIGEHFIRLLVKARSTYWFKYEVRTYGKRLGTKVHLERVSNKDEI